MPASSRPAFTLVSTSDRYDLQWEREAALAAVPNLDVALIPAAPETEAELIACAAGADGLLLSSREGLSRAAFAALPRCKVVSRYAVGLDQIDLDAATEHGVVVTHFPDYCTEEVADHALALILALNRRIVELDRNLRAGAWVEHAHHMDRILRGPVSSLRAQTVGVVGFGRIGRQVVKRLRPFGCAILVADPYVPDGEIEAAGATAVPLRELLRRSDIVTLHCPLNEETRGLIGAAELTLMKRSATLINTARGPIVDLDALVAALREGRLAGAGLDVVYPEPLPLTSPLYELDGVILTPHAAYYSEQSVETVRRETFFAALDVLRGRVPKVVANPEVLARVRLAPRDDG